MTSRNLFLSTGNGAVTNNIVMPAATVLYRVTWGWMYTSKSDADNFIAQISTRSTTDAGTTFERPFVVSEIFQTNLTDAAATARAATGFKFSEDCWFPLSKGQLLYLDVNNVQGGAGTCSVSAFLLFL